MGNSRAFNRRARALSHAPGNSILGPLMKIAEPGLKVCGGVNE